VGALVVQQLERDLDMRGEVIETVLSCLELWDMSAIERRCRAATAKAAATSSAAAAAASSAAAAAAVSSAAAAAAVAGSSAAAAAEAAAAAAAGAARDDGAGGSDGSDAATTTATAATETATVGDDDDDALLHAAMDDAVEQLHARAAAYDASHDDADGAALGGGGLVRVLPDIRATCELSFHSGSPQELAGRCPLAAAVLEIAGKPKQGAYRFSVAAAARHMRSGLEEVGAQLQALSANNEAAYKLTDRAIGYEIIRGVPTNLRPLAAALADHLTAVEASGVCKLDTVYAALETAANADDDEAQGASLRTTLQAYLGDGGGGGKVCVGGGGGGGAMEELDLGDVVVKEAPRDLLRDVRELLTHRSGGKAGGAGSMSARNVARVLHGLGSPAYPAQEWRRNPLWERHANVDFPLIVKVASEELLVMRGVKR
jgi:hypothetical protein